MTGLGCLRPWIAKESKIGRILAQQERLKMVNDACYGLQMEIWTCTRQPRVCVSCWPQNSCHVPCVILCSIPSSHLETHKPGGPHTSLDFMLNPGDTPLHLALPRTVSPPEEAMAGTHTHPRQGLPVPGHPRISCLAFYVRRSTSTLGAPCRSYLSTLPTPSSPSPDAAWMSVLTVC